MNNNKIIIFIGASSAGKDKIAKKITEYTNNFFCVSDTTRPIRDGETNGIEYYFNSDDEFLEKINKNEFIEYRTYNTLVDNISQIWYYGLRKEELEYRLSKGNVILILDPQGVRDFLSYFGRKNVIIYHVYADEKIREERSKLRGSHNQFEWERRLKDDKIIFSPYNLEYIVDYELINNGVNQFAQNIRFILKQL